jgi:hypothetical protein
VGQRAPPKAPGVERSEGQSREVNLAADPANNGRVKWFRFALRRRAPLRLQAVDRMHGMHELWINIPHRFPGTTSRRQLYPVADCRTYAYFQGTLTALLPQSERSAGHSTNGVRLVRRVTQEEGGIAPIGSGACGVLGETARDERQRATRGFNMTIIRCLRALSGLRPNGCTLGLALLMLWPAQSSIGAAAENPIRIEINTIENVQNSCRLSFVIENKGETPIETLKLDLAVFGREGSIQRRLIVELGPLRGSKTVVRAFDVEGDCGQIGSVLVNDVTACAPGDPGTCLDRLTLSSRPSAIRLFK